MSSSVAPSSPFSHFFSNVRAIWQTRAPWQRMAKYGIAASIAIILALLPFFRSRTNFLMPMVAVFAQPGQRMGVLVESLLLVLVGSLLGLSWSLLGLHLANLVEASNAPAAQTIRGVFLLVAVLFHGYIRSSSPRLIGGVLLLLIVSLLTLQQPTNATTSLFTIIYVPILFAAAVLLVVNLTVFPELSSSYLGSSTIDTLCDAMDTLTHATYWFVTPGGDPDESQQCRPVVSNGAFQSQKSDESSWRNLVEKVISQLPNPFQPSNARSILASLPHQSVKLSHLTSQKGELRGQLSRCKAAQDEINFEVCLSPLPPTAMKPISLQYMADMVQNVLTLIGACENKFVVIGRNEQICDTSSDDEASQTQHAQSRHGTSSAADVPETPKSRTNRPDFDRIESVRPVRELEASSAELLESILARIRGPVQDFQSSLTEAANLVVLCLAHCFDVSKLPTGAPAPRGIPLEEVDLRIDQFANALAVFDAQTAEQLRQVTMDHSDESIDMLPGMETFLASSFVLAFRGAAAQVLEMLRHSRHLLERRQLRNGRSRLWMPQYTSFRHWLTTGGDADKRAPRKKPKKDKHSKRRSRKPSFGRVEPRSGQPIRPDSTQEKTSSDSLPGKQEKPEKECAPETGKRGAGILDHPRPRWTLRLRAKIADAMEWAQGSDDVDYALKLAVAVFLVTWPALVTSWASWYAGVRGIWAPLQLILVFEIAIGTSVFAFVIRLFGVVYGCVVGYFAHLIGGGNQVVLVVVVIVGLVPAIYAQIITKYAKAGMIAIVSMSVVAIAASTGNTPAYEVFYKRLAAFLVGGVVAMLVEVVVAPVRARDRLVESLSASVRQVQKMQAALAIGIDGPEKPNLQSAPLLARFSHSRNKAQAALGGAETFLPFCLSEPRLKGSFKPLEPIYKEIIYVLHQIIDRMDNVMKLRQAYGSSILEDLNPQVYAYRRNVAASSTLMLFLINEALTTWLPLPQFIPSARLAQLRLINRVRQVLASNATTAHAAETAEMATTDVGKSHGDGAELDEEMTASVVAKRKLLSWNASTAGQTEVIEYLEELVELVKLLVGVNAFRSGMLERPTYKQYIGRFDAIQGGQGASPSEDQAGASTDPSRVTQRPEFPLPRAATLSQLAERLRARGGEEAEGEGSSAVVVEDGIPASLQRVGTRLRRESSTVRRRAFTFGPRGA